MAVREKRTILRSLFTPGSKKFRRLRSDFSRLLFIALIVNADDDGRIEGDPETVRNLIPWCHLTNRRVISYLKDLKSVGLVTLYDTERVLSSPSPKCYIEIVNFTKSQSWHGVSRDEPSLPPPPLKQPIPVEPDTSSPPSPSVLHSKDKTDLVNTEQGKKEQVKGQTAWTGKVRVERFVRTRLGQLFSTHKVSLRLDRHFEGWVVRECQRLEASQEEFVDVLEWAVGVDDRAFQNVRAPEAYLKANFEGWLEQWRAGKESRQKMNGHDEDEMPRLVPPD